MNEIKIRLRIKERKLWKERERERDKKHEAKETKQFEWSGNPAWRCRFIKFLKWSYTILKNILRCFLPVEHRSWNRVGYNTVMTIEWFSHHSAGPSIRWLILRWLTTKIFFERLLELWWQDRLNNFKSPYYNYHLFKLCFVIASKS